MNYICLVDNLIKYIGTDLNNFNHYRMIHYEKHKDADVQYLTLTDEEYDEMFPYEEDEEE